MGKSSSTSDYSSGTVSLNGSTKATSSSSGNTVNTSYNMSDSEQSIYDYAISSFADSLSGVNVFSEETQQSFADQIEAYTNSGLQLIEDTYTPILQDMQTDIASRFGNFDNSAFLNSLSEIEESRSDAMSSLAQDVLIQQESLIDDELSERYEYLSYLFDIYNSMNTTAMSYMGLASDNSSSGNSYNTSTESSSQTTSQMYANLLTSLMGMY